MQKTGVISQSSETEGLNSGEGEGGDSTGKSHTCRGAGCG